jgi:hypothetical protein
MKFLGNFNVNKMFDSVIMERQYDALYTTIHHSDCNFTFGGQWERKYSFHSGYKTGAKHFVCPNCGIYSNPERDKIYYSTNEDDVYPLNLNIDIWNYKHFLDLKIRYKGIQLRFDGKRIDRGICTETLRFDFKRKIAVFIDNDHKRHDLTVEFIRTHEVLPVLKYINKSYAVHSSYKKRLNVIFKTLRLAFERRLKEVYGFDIKGVYIPPSVNEYGGYFKTMLMNMALKMQAPDMPPITDLIKNNNSWEYSYGIRPNVAIPFEDDVLDLTRKGMNFLEALRITSHAPNSRSLRKAMIDNPMMVKMANILNLFKDENCRRKIVTLNRKIDNSIPHYEHIVKKPRHLLECMKVTTQEIRDMWLNIINRFGEKNVLKWLLSEEQRNINDTVNMYQKLKPSYRELLFNTKFRLKSFHDTMITIFNKQEYGDVNLPKLPMLNADINGLHFVVPKTAADLMTAGKQLKNCVGSYKDDVMKGITAIVVVTDDNMKPVACLELSKNEDKFSKLVQAKLFGNQCVSKNKNVNDTVLTWASQLQIEPRTIDIEAQVS